MITARTMGELIKKVYAQEGWTRALCENQTKRIKTTYELAIDYKANRFTATRKELTQ
jgi:hypothetical protein